MPETDIRTLVSFETDEKGINDARKALKQVEKDQQALLGAFKRGEKDAKEFNAEMAKLATQEKGLQKAIDAATGEFTQQTKEMREAAEAAAELAKRQAQLSTAQGRFDDVSQKVALAGDTGSSLRTIGGAAGAFGATGVDQAVGKASELFAVVEALPKLKAAAAGLPQAVSVAANALGTSPAGLIGIMGAAAIAAGILSFAIGKLREQMQKEVSAIQAAAGIVQDVNLAVAGGLTTDEATTRIEAINREIDATLLTIENLKTAQQNLVDVSFGGDARRALNTDDYKEFTNQIETLTNSIAGSELEQRKLTAAIEDGRTAANDAAEAEQALADQRIASVLAEAQQAGELATLKARVGNLTQEQIDGELEALSLREAGLKAEIAALQTSGETSEQVSQRIAELTNQLGFLGEQSATLSSARSTARSEAAEKAAEDAAKAQEEAARAQERAGQEALRSAESAAKQREDAQQKALEQQRQFEEAINNLRADTANKRVEQEINHVRKLQDIVTHAGDQREDALEEQSFLALRNINKEERRARRDQITDNKRANEDITRNAENEHRKLLQQAKSATQQRLQMEASALTQSSRNVQNWATGLVRITDQMARQFQQRLDSQLTGDSQFRQQASYTQTQPRTR